jgi:hypothetical protein
MAGCIYYYCSAEHTYALGIFAAYHAKRTAGAIRILPYNALSLIPKIGPGAHIFTDFDRQTPEQRARAGTLADALAGNGSLVLNHPQRTLRRHDLLRALHDAGINAFNSYRLSDWKEAHRYPVFIRHADRHVPTLTDLLEDREALQAAALRLIGEHGADSDLIVVEFGNARDEQGRYRKYSAFRVGGCDYASTCQSSDHWWIKYAHGEVSALEREQHLKFVADNPHREQLDAVWKVGKANYGRVDYCVVDGRVQTFEINTSPTIAYLPSHNVADHWGMANEQHDDALARLLDEAGGEETRNPLHNPAKAKLNARAVHDIQMRFGAEHWPRQWERPQD